MTYAGLQSRSTIPDISHHLPPSSFDPYSPNISRAPKTSNQYNSPSGGLDVGEMTKRPSRRPDNKVTVRNPRNAVNDRNLASRSEVPPRTTPASPYPSKTTLTFGQLSLMSNASNHLDGINIDERFKASAQTRGVDLAANSDVDGYSQSKYSALKPPITEIPGNKG